MCPLFRVSIIGGSTAHINTEAKQYITESLDQFHQKLHTHSTLICTLAVCSTAASVSVPMEAKQYVRHLVEQCMMQFFIAVKARESGQLFLKVSGMRGGLHISL